MHWRYQPVYEVNKDKDGNETRSYSIIEVYFNEEEKLDAWTEPSCDPAGDSQWGLANDLSMMLQDALKYEAVNYDELKQGMTFEEKEE